jgi:glycerol kinase
MTAAFTQRAASAIGGADGPRRRTALCLQIIAELLERRQRRRRDRTRIAHGPSACSGLTVSYWKVIMSVRLSVGDFGFKGSFLRLPLP